MRTRKIAFIVPRYGVESAGGAEVLAKHVAEHLAAAGHGVSVFTTCARDHFTWENHYKPGRETLNGVEVCRFPADPRDTGSELCALQARISRGMQVSRDEEEAWIRGSVHSRALYDSIAKHRDDFDCFIFLPYLFGTTWAGSAIAPEKSLIIPCLHDEPYARLAIFKEMFGSARGMIFNSDPERKFAIGLCGLAPEKGAVAGMGFVAMNEYRPERFRKKSGIKAPFIMYAGRREQGKNTPLLVEYFRAFKNQHGGELKLLFLGTGDVTIPPELSRDVIDLGYVSEELKHDCYAASLALCQPSTNESLSIVLMEAWLAGAAGMVNGNCAVTSFHCIRANGGLLFRDYCEFAECLLFLMEREGLREHLAAGGRRYVETAYSWDAVLKRYEAAFDQFGL
jgi:glycosyltransferase involved in cell wall biosynthesis